MRPHFSFGTVEVRISDAQSTATESEALSALITACVAQAAGSLVLGGPVHALERLLQVPGAPSLRAGDLISTGALTGRSHPVQRGEQWTASHLGGPLLPLPTLEIV